MLTAASRRRDLAAIAVVFLVAVAVFWRTAYPTITWWDSSGYSTVAATLGIIAPPGSLLLTLLGSPVAHLPVASPAHALNLFAGVLAGIAVSLLLVVSLRLYRIAAGPGDSVSSSAGMTIGAALGALAFAFSTTLWEHATKFTPYILTVVFTCLILLTLLTWWENAERPESWKLLALTAFLFGLDFSVHRTNSLLIPGALVWIVARDHRAVPQPRAVAGAALGFIVGISVQFLVMPIAASTHSPVNFFNPSNLGRFWDYVSLKHLGGNFLLQLTPRKSPFWTAQVMDVVRVVGKNFFNVRGPLSVLGALPALAVVLGVITLWRRNATLASAFVAIIVLQAAATVIYFNIPANYFRTFDRHYLPVCTTLGLLGVIGLGRAVAWGAAFIRHARLAPIAAGALAAIVPAMQLRNNWRARDASQQHFARDFATNILSGLPANAILFTVGDNDTYPLLYVHAVEGVRPDVSIVNVGVSTMPSFQEVMRRMDPSFPQHLTDSERAALLNRRTDTTIVVPVSAPAVALGLGLAEGDSVPASVSIHVAPTRGTTLLAEDISLFDVVTANRWKRPLCFSVTGTKNAMAWLAEYARLDGLFYRVMPFPAPPTNVDLLRENLFHRTEFRGYSGPAPILEYESRTIALNYYSALEGLLQAEHARGDDVRCRADAQALIRLIPPARLDLGVPLPMERACR